MEENILNCGKLYICPTPIGNLEDITFRVLRVLKEVDYIAAEDTRNSIKLLNHFAIKTKMYAYHEHNKISKGEKIIDDILKGQNVALISDAGMPGISDPGEELIKMAYKHNVNVEVLPGASAFVTALVLSGKSTRNFAFEAFLPKDKKKRIKALERIKNEVRTICLYEAPHHLLATLLELKGYVGENREISICRELTKKHEQCLRLTIGEAINYYKSAQLKGEFVIVLAGKPIEEVEEEQSEKWNKLSLSEHMAIYLDKGMDKKSAMKEVAHDRNVSKRDIYNSLLNE